MGGAWGRGFQGEERDLCVYVVCMDGRTDDFMMLQRSVGYLYICLSCKLRRGRVGSPLARRVALCIRGSWDFEGERGIDGEVRLRVWVLLQIRPCMCHSNRDRIVGSVGFFVEEGSTCMMLRRM